MSFVFLVILILVLVLVVLTSPLFKPDIFLTTGAPQISETLSKEIAEQDQEARRSCRGEECYVSPDGKYRFALEGVDDRDWLDKLTGLGYTTNGLTRITILDNKTGEPLEEVAVLKEVDPGSGRSYNIVWSANSKYVSIAGTVRNNNSSANSEVQQINYVFIVEKGELYSR